MLSVEPAVQMGKLGRRGACAPVFCWWCEGCVGRGALLTAPGLAARACCDVHGGDRVRLTHGHDLPPTLASPFGALGSSPGSGRGDLDFKVMMATIPMDYLSVTFALPSMLGPQGWDALWRLDGCPFIC